MKPINSLPPFKRFCVTIGNLPSSYVDSMSYYECLMWLCKYLKDTVIPAINENAEAVNELINWFNNLDVQDEINNKLDEMVESGELQEIISEYLNSQAVFGYDTVADMKSAENLINGSYAKTLGYYSLNDGGGATYKIRTITNEDSANDMDLIAIGETLVAELIIENNQLNINQFGAKIDDNTFDNSTILEYAIEYNQTHKCIITANAGTYYFDSAILINDEINDLTIEGYSDGVDNSNNTRFIYIGTLSFLTFNNTTKFVKIKNLTIIGNDTNSFITFIGSSDILHFKDELTNLVYDHFVNGITVENGIYFYIRNITAYGQNSSESLLKLKSNGKVSEYVYVEDSSFDGNFTTAQNGIICDGLTISYFNNLDIPNYPSGNAVKIIGNSYLLHFDNISTFRSLNHYYIYSNQYIRQLLFNNLVMVQAGTSETTNEKLFNFDGSNGKYAQQVVAKNVSVRSISYDTKATNGILVGTGYLYNGSFEFTNYMGYFENFKMASNNNNIKFIGLDGSRYKGIITDVSQVITRSIKMPKIVDYQDNLIVPDIHVTTSKTDALWYIDTITYDDTNSQYNIKLYFTTAPSSGYILMINVD